MQLIRKNGATSNILRVRLRNSSTGQGLTGLSSASSGLIISTICDNEATVTAYTVAGSTIETISSLGTFATPTSTKCRFKEVDSTNDPGLYELQLADARFAVSNAKTLRIFLSGATNLLGKEVLVQLTATDIDDSVRHGLTALPNAAAEASGGLVTRGTGTGQISVSSGQVILQSGTGAGQLDFTSGILKVDVNTIKTQTITCSAGVTVGAFVGNATAAISVDASGKLLLQATQSGVTIPTVTTLTNAPSDSSGVTTLLTRIPSGLFTGITSLAQWLGLIAGKQTGNSTARTEIRATGAGSGTFDETTDSIEALRDRGDTAWITATGFSTHSAADVWAVGTRTLTAIDEDSTTLDLDATIRAAVGMSSANMDTQLDALPTNSELSTALAAADDATLAAIAALSIPTTGQIATAVLTTQMTESYRATNAAPTLAQALFELIAHMGEASISSTTKTLKKLDGSTTAKTYTLDDDTAPTSITETT